MERMSQIEQELDRIEALNREEEIFDQITLDAEEKSEYGNFTTQIHRFIN